MLCDFGEQLAIQGFTIAKWYEENCITSHPISQVIIKSCENG